MSALTGQISPYLSASNSISSFFVREKGWRGMRAMGRPRSRVGGKLEPPGQGRRSRLTCPPTDLRERARATSGSKKHVWGKRSGGIHAVRGSRGHGGGKLEPPGQGRRSRLTCPPTDLRERARAASGSKKYVWGEKGRRVSTLCVGPVVMRSSRRAKAGAAGSPASRHRTTGAHPPPKKEEGNT